MKVIGVIPARWASTRLPQKVLALINGRPMIEHVWRRAKQSRLLDEVYIACDHEEVAKVATSFGAQSVMTSPDHQSGTDRIAEVAQKFPAEIVLNIQGDEPLLKAQMLDDLARVMRAEAGLPMATVIKRVEKPEDLTNPAVVKVVINHKAEALYFSRSLIPFNRENKPFHDCKYYKHLGIYAYRREFLLGFKSLPHSSLEDLEKLEQLRVLEAGYRIKTVETSFETAAVDTPQDLAQVEAMMKQEAA